MFKPYSILTFLLFLSSLHACPLDFDQTPSDFIINTKQIVIPNHPHAFNPSIVRWQGKLLLCFRELIPSKLPSQKRCFPLDTHESRLSLVWLNEEFEPISTPSILELSYHPFSRLEDPRLVVVANQLYIVYSDNLNHIYSGQGCRVFVAGIETCDDNFFVYNRECLSHFEGECHEKAEKNWVPFDYHGNLLLSYSIAPHRVLFPLCGTNTCEAFATSNAFCQWEWGELRGGTPALCINDTHYLSFFHSSVELATPYSDNKKALHYFIGAYTFSADYPFALTSISKTPFFEKSLYESPSYTPYWKPVRVIFPCGLIVEENDIWISYGKQDHEMWIMHVDKNRLMDTLVPINVDTKD